jgi:hypothetical protein
MSGDLVAARVPATASTVSDGAGVVEGFVAKDEDVFKLGIGVLPLVGDGEMRQDSWDDEEYF